MPDKHERYNRFMKWLCPGYGEPGSLEDRWAGYKSRCEVCGIEDLRNNLSLKSGILKCQTCLKVQEDLESTKKEIKT